MMLNTGEQQFPQGLPQGGLPQGGLFKPSIAEPTGADFGDSPLLDFIGVGAGYEVKGGKSKTTGNDWQRVYIRANAVQVLDSIEVYSFPTAEISIFYSDPTRTSRRREGAATTDWEIFCESLRLIYGKEREETALDDCFGGQVVGEGAQPAKPGRRFHMKRVDSFVRVGPDEEGSQVAMAANNPTEAKRLAGWHDAVVPVWRMLEVEGVGAAGNGVATPTNTVQMQTANGTTAVDPLTAHVLDLADGKVADKFYNDALGDSEVMANPGLVMQLTNSTFVGLAKSLGLLTEDPAGILHKAQ